MSRRGIHATTAAALLALAALLASPVHGTTGCANPAYEPITDPFTVSTTRDFECKALDLQANIRIVAGGVMTITHSTLDFADDKGIVVETGGLLILEGTPYDGDEIIVQGGRLKQSFFVDVEANGATEVWAWSGDGAIHVQATPVDGRTTLQLPLATHEGATLHDYMPWRIVASDGSKAAQTLITQSPTTAEAIKAEIDLPEADDTKAPTWPSNAAVTTASGVPYTTFDAVTIVWEPADDDTGVDAYEVLYIAPGTAETSLIVGATNQPQTTITGIAPGKHIFKIRPVDLVGNEGTFTGEFDVVYDASAPRLSARLSPPLPTGQGGWYHRAPTVTLEGSDEGGSGLASIAYRLHGEWREYESAVTVNESKDHLIDVRAMDHAGNTFLSNVRVPVDLEAPTVEAAPDSPAGKTGWHRGPVTVLVDAQDPVSGIQSLAYRIGGGTWTPFQDFLVINHGGGHEVQLRASDRAGNLVETTLVVRIDSQAPLAPKGQWLVLADGKVRVDWSGDPPQDLVSGVARVFLERAGPASDVTGRVEATLEQGIHELGPYSVGEHRFRSSVEDHAGNVANGSWNRLTITQSSVGLHAVDSADKVRGVVPLTFNPVGDFVPTEIRFYVDGTLLATLSDSLGAVEWDTTRHVDGQHEVRVVALDADGHAQEEVQTFHVRNGYGATMADRAVAVASAGLLVAAVSALGVVGLLRWRGWQARYEGSASKHALSKHAPSHKTFEAHKLLHLASILAGLVLAFVVFVAPVILGTHHVPTFVFWGTSASLAVLALQVASIGFMMQRQRRVATEPHLKRFDAQGLDFDGREKRA